MNQETEKTVKVDINDSLKKTVKTYAFFLIGAWLVGLLVFAGFFYFVFWPQYQLTKQQAESIAEFQQQMLKNFGSLEEMQQQGPEKVIELQEQFKEQGPEIWKNMFDMLQQGATEMQGR